jgi:acyl-CoA thioesterase-1
MKTTFPIEDSKRRRANAFVNSRIFMRTTQLSSGKGFIGRIAILTALYLALSAAFPTPRVVLFLGDSITAGYGLEPSQAFPGLIEERIQAKKWNFKVINAGQSGDTTAGGLNRMDWLLKNPIDVLVLELGGNDGLRGLPAETTRKNLQAIIDRTREKYPQVKIILAGMKVPPNMGRDYSQRFNAIFAELAKKNKTEIIPFVLEGVGGVRELNLPDGIHPTAKGHEIVAANVWKVLEPVLRAIAGK